MLTRSQVVLFIGLGVAFWLTGVLMIRIAGPSVFTTNNPLLIAAYIACFPLLYLALFISSRVSRIPMNNMMEPIIIMTFSAIFIDGAVIAWLPQVYGDNTEQVMLGAAWLLWGAAAGLFCAWVLSRRATAGSSG